MSIPAIEPVTALADRALSEGLAATPSAGSQFSQFLLDGIQQTNQKLTAADTAVRAFALDDGVPVHQVTFALEQARLSFELLLQVRTRLVDAFQELTRMQL